MIEINNKFYIDSDKYNYMLVKKGTNQKTGEELNIVEGYFGSLEALCSHLLTLGNRLLVSSEKMSIKSFKEELEVLDKECLKEIERLVKEYGSRHL